MVSIDGRASAEDKGRPWTVYQIALFSPDPCSFDNITITMSLINGERIFVDEFTHTFNDWKGRKLSWMETVLDVATKLTGSQFIGSAPFPLSLRVETQIF